MARNVEFNEDVAIQKAMEVFWKNGYAGTSMRDLTDAMKINISSIYNTIGDKHELFVRCIKRYTEMRMADAKKRAAETKSPLKALIKEIENSVAVIVDGNSCMAIKTAFEMAGDDKNVQEILKADSDFLYEFIYGHLTRAIEEGEMAGDIDPQMLTDYLISIYTGWYESYIIHRDPVRIKKMANYLITQLSGS